MVGGRCSGFLAREALQLAFMACCSALGRALLTLVLLASWMVTTSHCALAAAATAIAAAQNTIEQTPDSDGCPMHAAKAAKSVPQKKKGCADLPCCKNLPAAKPVAKISVCKPPFFPVTTHTIDVVNQCAFYHAMQPVLLLDTGPPAPNSFIEFVLQRSIPAHAPPAV